MDKSKFEIIRLKMERTAEALRRNNMYCVCAESSQEVLEIIREMIDTTSTVTVGGSVTLFETGIIDMLRNEGYNFIDRHRDGLTAEEKKEIYIKTFCSDVFITSTNAVTEKGELYNVDGNGNRVAAMLYGPESVIVVAGYNKIVKNTEDAKIRVQEIAAPANALRLNMNTPCSLTGKCCNCMSDDKICASSVIMGRQRVRERIKVILVGEELGY